MSYICLQAGKQPRGHLFLQVIDCFCANQPLAAATMPGSPGSRESMPLPPRLQTLPSARAVQGVVRTGTAQPRCGVGSPSWAPSEHPALPWAVSSAPQQME